MYFISAKLWRRMELTEVKGSFLKQNKRTIKSEIKTTQVTIALQCLMVCRAMTQLGIRTADCRELKLTNTSTSNLKSQATFFEVKIKPEQQKAEKPLLLFR